MSAKPCARVWQAEAVLDGVLSRADAASFERHAATCAECTAERAALSKLANVAGRMPTQEVTALRRRALHNELLRRANELSVGARPRRLPGLRRWAPVLAGVLLLCALVSWRFVRRPSTVELAAAPKFELSAAPNSRWRVAQPGSALRLALENGTFTISVHKLRQGQRFSLVLPDGELEVRGTRFIVECDSRRTRRVAVEEGRVALRLAGQAELSLGPGQAWPVESARAPALAPASETGERAPANSARSSDAAPAAAIVSPGSRTRLHAASSPRKPASPKEALSAPSIAATATPRASEPGLAEAAAPSTAARDFAEAMSAFSHGDFGTSERLFRAFEQRYPQSPHAEDVLFLRALGRSRRGDASGARVLAREYLRRYPAGFRVVEAREMAREAPRPSLGASPGLVTFP